MWQRVLGATPSRAAKEDENAKLDSGQNKEKLNHLERLSWYGHVMRREDTNVAKQVTTMKV